MAETLSTISLFSFVAAGVFGILAIVLWFLFNIPAVIGDLSGRSAKKSVELMRRKNEKAAGGSFSSGAAKAGRGKSAGGTGGAGQKGGAGQGPGRGQKGGAGQGPGRGQKGGAGKNPGRGQGAGAGHEPGRRRQAAEHYETGLLDGNMASGCHSPGTELLVDKNATVKLTDVNGAVLPESGEAQPERKAPTVKIILLEELMYIHTKEVIECQG